jgi:bromodomain-containing protein 7
MILLFQDISKIKVDIEQLRSLSELGLDVEFLNEMEEDISASQHDYGIAPTLRHTYELLQKLEQEQRDRSVFFCLTL